MDKLIKATALNNQVRVYLASTTELVKEAIMKNDTYPSASSVLGKTLTMGAMMGAMLKGDEALTIKINGNGPIGNVIVDGNSKARVRGYVDDPHINFVNNKGGLNEAMTLGEDGLLEVIKDLKLKDFFTSSVPLQNGNLAYNFTYYFTVSEQTPSMVSLGSLFDVDNFPVVFGGIIIQLLPNASEGAICYLETKAEELNNFSKLLLENSLEDILKLLFIDDYHLLETMTPEFKCECSKEKFSQGLASLGTSELEDIINTDGQATCVCHYCKNEYTFSKDELIDILKKLQ